MNDLTSRSKVPAVIHAVAILRYLAEQGVASGVNAIARAVEVSPSSCFNILRTLMAESLVSFDDTSKTYSLGGGVVALARRALDPASTLDIARSELARLARAFHATSSLWRLAHDRRLMLLGFEASNAHTNIHMTVGQRIPLLLGAVGRSIVASSDIAPDTLKKMFDKIRWDVAPSFEEYLADIDAARRNGWAIDKGHFVRGATTVAAAIVDDQGGPRLSISTVMLGGHYEPDYLMRVGEATTASAKRLGFSLYGPPLRLAKEAGADTSQRRNMS